MIISIQTQVQLMGYSLIAGLITGILFDIYRIIRGFENPNKIITFLQDILFWMLSAMVVFVFLLYTNQGYIGLYVYLYIVLGIYLYIKFISKFQLILLNSIIKRLIKVIRIFFNIVIYPFQLLKYNNKIKNKKINRNDLNKM